MTELFVSFDKVVGKIKPMHSVCNGPVTGNFTTFKKLGIPYTRNHDASFFAEYGGEHTVDVHAIFPNFDADADNPESYDFTYTDEYTKTIFDADSEVFYRLGSKIEHGIKKYGTVPPKDSKKWAVICEHIIRHYTEGWANGFNYKITYWEIWNEADGVNIEGNQANWAGTAEQYYELYDITSRHLKSCFPHLKIGGPSLSCINDGKWLRGFLEYITKNGKAPLDFFTWHIYTPKPYELAKDNARIKAFLSEFGYDDTEIICDEYNYMEDFGTRFVPSLEHVTGIHGAAFTSAFMLTGQKDKNCDMLMFYTAAPCAWNGLFDYCSFRPIKGYYVFWAFSELYKIGDEVECFCEDKNIYACAASDAERRALVITHYDEDFNAVQKAVKLNIGCLTDYRMYVTDKNYTMTPTPIPDNGVVTLYPDTTVLIVNYML